MSAAPPCPLLPPLTRIGRSIRLNRDLLETEKCQVGDQKISALWLEQELSIVQCSMTDRGKIGALLVGNKLERIMPGTKATKTNLPKGVKHAPLREEPPVRWPSAATGSGAAYGVTHDPAPQSESSAESCGEN